MKNKFQSKSVPRGTRTIWRYLSALILLFSLSIGNVWADTFVNLRTVDFTEMTKKTNFANGKNTISDAGYTDLEFYQKNTDKPLKLNNASGEGIDFSGQNIGNSHFVAIPLTGINGQLKVTVYHKYSSGKASFKLGLKTGTTTVTPGDYSTNAQTPKDAANADVSCYYTYGTSIISTATTAVLFVGEAGTSYTQIKKVVIETLAPTCTPSTTTFANGNYTVGGSALDLTSLITADATSTGAITFAVKNANGTGATITGSSFTATASGTATVTATQAADATHGICEKSIDATITVVATTPVTEVTVNGPANGYKNNKVIFAATAANATHYRWTVDGIAQGSDSAKLHFTPTESKTYSIVCEAKNTYNSDWVASSAHSLTVTSLYGELIRATLTGGNNATMTGIIGGTFDSNLGSGKYKLDKNVYMGVQLASGSFQEGDTVIVSMTTAGSNYPCLFADKERNTLLYLATETSSALVYKMVLPAAANNKNTVYLSRDNDVTYKWNPVVEYISVVRPMPVKSTTYDLTAVKINGTPISAANLAVLKTADDYLLDLATEYPEGPTVKFARQTTNTYEDDSQKVLNDTITVTATEVSSKWQAQATIGTITYTVKMAKSAATAKVYYYDGATKLGEETVAINGNPVEAGDYDDKTLASFVGWYNNSDLAEEHKIANIAELVVTKDTTVYGKWTYDYASSINIEQWTLTNGAGKGSTTKTSALISLLGTNNFASNLVWENGNIELDSLDDAKGDRNEPYLGLKVKSGGKMLDFRVANGQTVKVKFGAIKSTLPQVSLNGGDYASMSLTEKVWSYTATGNDYISIKTADANAVVFKQIMINEDIAAVTLPWRVTYDANGGTCATAEAIWSGAALILPDVTPADADHTFAGWYDEVSGGELQGVAGASYTPTDNETLFAHFAPVEYAIAYDGNGATSGSMVAGAAGWGTLVTPATNAFEKTGHIFSGWEITKTEDGSATGITFSEGKFEMPKYDVTLVAQWEDNSKVAMIVETSAKYESLAEAIAAATDGQTVQLLQNIHQEDGVLINKSLTLDLNGKTFTVDNGNSYVNRAIKVDAGTGTVLIKDGTVDALSTEDHNGGCYGGLRIETGNVTCTNVTFKNYRIYGMGVKPAGGTLVMNECTVISEIGGGMEVAGGSVVLNNCTFTQTGFDTAHAWISSCLGIGHNANLTVNGGTYTSEHYSLYVFTSGGEIDVESGSFTGDIVNQVTLSSYPDAVGAINISGGSFEGVGGNPIHFTTDNTGKTTIAISGGTFDAPVENQYCAPGYVPAPEVAPGVYTVMPKDGVCLVKIEPTSQTKGTQTGLYADGDELTINLSSGMNLGSSGKYIGVKATENFQEGDVLHLNMSTYQNSQNATAYVYADKDASVFLFDTEEKCDENKDYYITMPAAVNGHKELYIVRTEGNKWNGGPSVMEVTRAMKPMLTAITIDGRDGVIDEANKTVAVQIPYEADLANLTIVPTIVWNEAAASNSIVVNDGSAWIEGANTYKLTDKDGDYTVYTITLTRDVLKHTVSYNTHGGSAVASELVEDGGYLAAAPADPTKEDYIFQYWSEDEDGAEVDVTTVQINADKEFHAVWASDGAIKLLDGATVNHTNFITGVTAENTVEFKGNEVHYAAFSGTVSGVNGVKDPTRVIAYNATTNKTKIQISAHNNSTSGRNILVKGLVEGADAATDLATIALGNKEDKVSDWIEFNNAANRTIYIMVSSSAGDVYFTQVKVIESGETPMKQAGEAGYALNLNKGRFFGLASTDLAFEGLNARLSGDYTALNSGYAKLTSTSMSFTVASAMTLSVTTNNNKTYYVTEGAAGTDNETAKTGVSEFDLTAGTWYITAGAAEVQITNIAFELPKCQKPTISAQPESKQTFGPGNLTATVVATVSDGGTLKYQWYDASNDDEVEGATSATLTTTTEGTYYVIVTNTLADHSDNFIKSAEATLGYRVTDDATLSALSYGTPATAIVLEADKYDYRVDLAMGTTDVPALAATATMAPYPTVLITDATEFVNYEATSTVLVTAEDGVTQKTYTVKFVVDHVYTALVDVTESTTWNWTGSTEAVINDVANKGLILANYIDGANFEMIEGKENERARRNQNGGVYQGTHLHFNTTVAGKVKFYFRAPSSGENCTITVKNNGKEMVAGTRGNSLGWSKEIVVKGDVVIEMVNDKEGGGDTRVQQIVFTELAPDYTRNVSSNYGTLCVDHNVLAGGAVGATFYQIASRNEQYNDKIDFEEVLPNEELKAGEPYIFQSTTGRIDLFYGATVADDPVAVRGMIGSFVNANVDIDESNKNDILYIANNKLWNCDNLVGSHLNVVANRAYIVMSDVPTYAEYQAAQTSNPAPRRRVTLGKDAEQVATGCENLNAADKPVKMIINGQLFIIRGEKMYDAKGQLVK